ncbi:clustered mitochondria protein homolog [Tubulanus polymorphus]|uniref:clustered mitochondria protein homolog n=1 Tax=Tubulanus polymorphus TaxID=672921 RepID=UPI003DA2E0BE
MAGVTDVDDQRNGTDSQNNDQTKKIPKVEEKSTAAAANGEVEKAESESLEKEKENGNAPADDHEVIFIQDTSFTVKIAFPGLETFDLPVSSMELVQEIQQVLHDREETCHLTCFSMQLDGVILDNFAELKSIDGLKEGSIIKIVEEPYTVREARIHVRHVRDLLKSVGPNDAYAGSECMSLSFLSAITVSDVLDKKRPKVENIDCTPPEYVIPNAKDDTPLLALHPLIDEQRAPQCLKVVTYSGWNPPPGTRKMHGDLLYLKIVTLEDRKYHITASTKGFYINQSTDDVFNPKAAQQKHLSHSLIGMLNQISPGFKRNFSLLLKKRAQKHPFERVPTPYQVYSWIAPPQEHTVDSIRGEDAFSSKLGYEEHIPGQTRDWNEELQTTRELPRKSLPERIIRERAIFKIHSDFVAAATKAAVAVIDGNIMAINPGESSKMQMFIWNNIFFSLGFDVKDHYKDFGGDNAAYVAPSNDLQGVKSYMNIDPEGLFTLGTVVVDYRGYRVTAQSIIPGILEREQEQSVVYGSIDFGKTIVTNEQYVERLKKTAGQLKIRPHKVINEKNEEFEIFSAVECKGIIGNDGRYYILDLLRTCPPDVNFLPIEGEELNDRVKEMGFPIAHRHKLACLRQELIESFVETKYLAFIKHAAWHFQQLRLKKLAADKSDNAETAEGAAAAQVEEKPAIEAKIEDEEVKKSASETSEEKTSDGGAAERTDSEVEEAKKLVEQFMGTETTESFEDSTKDIVKSACHAVGSLSDTAFDITFNPDVFQPHVKHVNPEGEEYKKDCQLVKDAAEFLVLHQIPSLVKECLEHQTSPIDGKTLTEAMHQRGINMRYLGKLVEILQKYPSLVYLKTIGVVEMITRAVKHVFNTYMEGVEMMNLAAAISHFLNCYLSSSQNITCQIAADELQGRNKKKNKKKNRHISVTSQGSTDWALESSKSLWRKIVEEVKSYYKFNLGTDSLEATVEKYSMYKPALLRAVCHKLGIQLRLRDYHMDNKHKQTFHEDDILNLFPTVKHLHPKAGDAYNFFNSGQAKIQQGLLREGHDLVSESLNLLNNVYGPLHPEIAACNKLLARLNYIMGEHNEALMYQQRAVMISERVLGIDHPACITEYSHLALYCFANGQLTNSLKLLYRAHYLAMLCAGPTHPEIALIDSNIGLILHALGEYEMSLKFLEKALKLNILFYGADSLKVAMSHHLVARAHSCRGDFRTAFASEKSAYNIYKDTLGDSHDRTQESSECLKHLTQQAVVFQKKLDEISRGESVGGFPPIQIQSPSLASVLETLNIINGIVFVHLSPQEIQKLRDQIIASQGGASGSEEAAGTADEQPTTKSDNGADSTQNDNSNGVDVESEAAR